MYTEDLIYVFSLILSIAFGHVFRLIPSPYKKYVSTVAGLLIICAGAGWHIFHQIIITAFTILLLQYGPKKYCHTISFAVLFSYLLLFRFCPSFGIIFAYPAQCNAIQMMLTLKLVGICFEVHDTWEKEGSRKKTEDDMEKVKLDLDLKYNAIRPSALDIFHYAFSYIGILTGPYYKYRVFQDALSDDKVKLDCLQATKKRMMYLPLYIGLYLIASTIWPLSYAKSEEIFTRRSFMYRVWYMTPTFFIFRMRLYSGFILSECVCIMAGLGGYPKDSVARPGNGPTNYEALENSDKNSKIIEYDFETVHNIDEWNSDFAPTVRGGMRAWNMTVQYWLVANVYKRLKWPKPAKEAVTMLVSAFWHGVYSGYYLSMLTVPFILAVEDYFEKKVRRNLGQTGQKVYDFFSLIMKMQHFAYMGMAFLLLHVDSILTYWRSIGFLFHGIIALQHALAQFMNLVFAKIKKKLKTSRETVYVNEYSKMKIVKTKDEVTKTAELSR